MTRRKARKPRVIDVPAGWHGHGGVFEHNSGAAIVWRTPDGISFGWKVRRDGSSGSRIGLRAAIAQAEKWMKWPTRDVYEIVRDELVMTGHVHATAERQQDALDMLRADATAALRVYSKKQIPIE
jgi:hypothetical protein